MRCDYSSESGSTVSLQVISEIKSHSSTIRKIKFLPNTKILVSGGGADGRIYLTDCDKDELLFYLDNLDRGHGQVGKDDMIYT